jgi:hypothetical protein
MKLSEHELTPIPPSQRKTDVLQGLDAVPWAELEHAYGSAADVPDLLRKLLDPDPKVRREVLRTLCGNVFHQGTRYPAVAHRVNPTWRLADLLKESGQ